MIPHGFKPWVGFDLDGTLAMYEYWQGPDHIGSPVPEMVRVLMGEIEQGEREGYEVRIFTARACVPSDIRHVKKWLADNRLPDLEVTCVKDHGMRRLYDDRVIKVEKNTGRILA
jgi:hypothetical protein